MGWLRQSEKYRKRKTQGVPSNGGFKQKEEDLAFSGTAYTGLMKMRSEEANHATCWSCGYGGGRHSRNCEVGKED